MSTGKKGKKEEMENVNSTEFNKILKNKEMVYVIDDKDNSRGF